MLKALADPERLRIVECLRAGPKDVSELTRLLRRPIANISHHLQVLRRSRFVLARKTGRHVIYSLSAAVVGLDQVSLDLDCCRLVLGKARNSVADHSRVR
jgi:DNA-binding transcriptional ArsR family regulator